MGTNFHGKNSTSITLSEIYDMLEKEQEYFDVNEKLWDAKNKNPCRKCLL